jgi:hypothetical protein
MLAGPAAPLAFAQGRAGNNLRRNVPQGVKPTDPLLNTGCLDVTKAPYFADPSGAKDSTAAIQRAVNDARDYQYVCFFPGGTYLVGRSLGRDSLRPRRGPVCPRVDGLRRLCNAEIS